MTLARPKGIPKGGANQIRFGHACAGDLLGSLRRCLERFPDKRRGLNVIYLMTDIGMAAFSVFFMQSPSFLSHQRRFEEGHGRSNCQALFGLSKVPSDNHIRDMLDAATPDLLNPMFFRRRSSSCGAAKAGWTISADWTAVC
ncbi:hypothetical protein [Mesorhizobium sp. M0204]|uniref:hypothetical protein n=1 Tax=unclassified Mesorhizobium TaxID=325217 RepID=UPI003337FA75